MLEPRARNAISTIALATGVAYPLAYFAFQLWSPLSTAHAPGLAPLGLNPILNPSLPLAIVWLVALVLALVFSPRLRGFKATIVLAIAGSIALIIVNRAPGIGNEWYGLMSTSLLFLALLGALALFGTPARGLRLVIPTGIAFATITCGYLAAQLIVRDLYFDERYFWNMFLGVPVTLVIGAVIAAILLALTHCRAAAQTVTISAIPWGVVVLRFSGSQNLWGTLALLGIAAALVGFGALLPLAFRRAQPTRVKPEMPPS
jgi:hypothetical protein